MTATGVDAGANPYRFASAYLDTGTGLYKTGARYYNPTYGRFLTQDSVDHTGDLTQGNNYAYTGDNPVNVLDPTGEGFCLLGHNPNGSCRGSSEGRKVEHVVKSYAAPVVGCVIGAAGALSAASDYIDNSDIGETEIGSAAAFLGVSIFGCLVGGFTGAKKNPF